MRAYFMQKQLCVIDKRPGGIISTPLKEQAFSPADAGAPSRVTEVLCSSKYISAVS